MKAGPWKAAKALPSGWLVMEWRDGEWVFIAACKCADDATTIAMTLNRVEWGEPYPHLPDEHGRAA